MKTHFLNGKWADDNDLKNTIDFYHSKKSIDKILDINILLNACEKLSTKILKDKNTINLFKKHLSPKYAEHEILEGLIAISEFINPDNLKLKIKRELGDDPFNLRRLTYNDDIFEKWHPIGKVLHIAPSNAFTVSVLAAIEGLITGNINFLKLSSSDTLFACSFFDELIKCDERDELKNFIYVFRLSSGNSLFKKIFTFIDAASSWGTAQAVSSVKALCGDGTRFIQWGPKISFAYISKENIFNTSMMNDLAEAVCISDQQLCSSPQCVYLEGADKNDMKIFCKKFMDVFYKVSAKLPQSIYPNIDQKAEITSVSLNVKLTEPLGEGELFEASDKSFRLMLDYNSNLKASPLFRSLWIKPIIKDDIVSILSPYKYYLQTAGLCCPLEKVQLLSALLFKAGVNRITDVLSMNSSYYGEPHDGIYGLQQFLTRVSFKSKDLLKDYSSFSEFKYKRDKSSKGPILTKDKFCTQEYEHKPGLLFFKSGGSSGDAVLSSFTYDDYHFQMKAAADGLYAAGFDPLKDKVINLFYGGDLYGGFLSFFTILEYLRATQYPMGASKDYSFVAEMIIKHGINTILGMPSYIMQLFSSQKKILLENKIIKKIFYGGEFFGEQQIAYLKQNFNIDVIKSAAYGSVDAGPLGYQCAYCGPGEFHLQTKLQALEIIDFKKDVPVKMGEKGRLIFTSKARSSQKVVRYDIGDIGKWCSSSCKCLRTDPKFILMGRIGDIVKAGTVFINYQKILSIFEKHLSYKGELQLKIKKDSGSNADVLEINLTPFKSYDVDKIKNILKDNYFDIRDPVKDKLLLLNIIFTEKFIKTEKSGKLKHIIDYRNNN